MGPPNRAERRTKPEEIERQMRELLASQRELDAEEAAALADVPAEKDVPAQEDRACFFSFFPWSSRLKCFA